MTQAPDRSAAVATRVLEERPALLRRLAWRTRSGAPLTTADRPELTLTDLRTAELNPKGVIEMSLPTTEAQPSVPQPRDTSLRLVPPPSALDGLLPQVDMPPTARPVARPRVSVVIPTYNEAKNLPDVMSRIPDDVHEVIVVDGHSVDGTVEVAQSLRPDVVVVMQNRRGKGNAMACGFAAVTGDIVVMLDADGSAAPEEIARFVDALLDGADFAKGSRFAAGGGSNDITPIRAWGNRWLNRMANVLFGTRYTDLCYGYNAFWRDCLDHLELETRPQHEGDKRWGDGFEIETIINTRMAKARMRITEVPSFEFQRVHGESNLNTWRDGSRVLWALVVERVNGAGRRQATAQRALVAVPNTQKD